MIALSEELRGQVAIFIYSNFRKELGPSGRTNFKLNRTAVLATNVACVRDNDMCLCPLRDKFESSSVRHLLPLHRIRFVNFEEIYTYIQTTTRQS